MILEIRVKSHTDMVSLEGQAFLQFLVVSLEWQAFLQFLVVSFEGQAFLQLLNDVTQLEDRTQLQTHVLHHHLTVQQQQCFSINFLKEILKIPQL